MVTLEDNFKETKKQSNKSFILDVDDLLITEPSTNCNNYLNINPLVGSMIYDTDTNNDQLNIDYDMTKKINTICEVDLSALEEGLYDHPKLIYKRNINDIPEKTPLINNNTPIHVPNNIFLGKCIKRKSNKNNNNNNNNKKPNKWFTNNFFIIGSSIMMLCTVYYNSNYIINLF